MRGAGSGPARGRPFVVAVGALRRRPGSRLEVAVEGVLSDHDLRVTNSWVPDGAAVGFSGTLESAIGGVTVSGTVRSQWEGTCRRCLDTAKGELDIRVRELCVDDPDPELGYGVGSEWLDLEPILHDSVILELPLAPLCLEACRGLCPQCGANRNREACSCEVPADPRWAALVDLVSEGPQVGQATGTSKGSDDGRPEEEDV